MTSRHHTNATASMEIKSPRMAVKLKITMAMCKLANAFCRGFIFYDNPAKIQNRSDR